MNRFTFLAASLYLTAKVEKELQVATLSLEVGKRYKDTEGRVVLIERQLAPRTFEGRFEGRNAAGWGYWSPEGQRGTIPGRRDLTEEVL